MNLVSIECPKVTAVGKSVTSVMCLCPTRESRPYCACLHGPVPLFHTLRQLRSPRCPELYGQPPSPKWEDAKITQYFQFGFSGFSSEMVYDERDCLLHQTKWCWFCDLSFCPTYFKLCLFLTITTNTSI